MSVDLRRCGQCTHTDVHPEGNMVYCYRRNQYVYVHSMVCGFFDDTKGF